MKIHSVALSFIVLFTIVLSASADLRLVNDPVADYITRHSSDLRSPEETNEHILKFEVDINNDGKIDVFLSSEKSALQSKDYDNSIRSWDLYKNEGDGNYAVIDQEKSTLGLDFFFHTSAFLFDPEKVFIGSISEMGGEFGILAMFYTPRKNEAFISAYILGDGFFESKNFPNPALPEAGVYHRDDTGSIPDLPDEYRHYFETPPTQTVTVLAQTF